MEETVNDAIESLLEEVQAELDDPEVSFKLRTARQLNLASKTYLLAMADAVDTIDLDPEDTAQLQELKSLG